MACENSEISTSVLIFLLTTWQQAASKILFLNPHLQICANCEGCRVHECVNVVSEIYACNIYINYMYLIQVEIIFHCKLL